MTQTPGHQKPASIGAAAAAAAAGATTPATNKPEDKPADKPNDKPANGQAAAGEKKTREAKRKVFIVVGEVREFESIVQAEKHLNSPEAPTGDYTVLQGARTKTSKKVSLR